jgi:hypothetical protein
MSSKIWLINFILAAFVIFFAVKTYDVWFDNKVKELKSPHETKNIGSDVEKKFSKRKLPPESNYEIIVEKNLFREERTEYLPEPEPDPDLEPGTQSGKEPEIKSLESFGAKIDLYGVVLWKDYKKALVTNTERNIGGSGEKWVQKGDTILEVKKLNENIQLVVEEIFEDRILIKDGKDCYEILLYDKDKSKKRGNVDRSQGPEVISSVDRSKQQGAVKSIAAGKERNPEKDNNVKKEAPSEPEYEVINTPFGKIKRRKQ